MTLEELNDYIDEEITDIVEPGGISEGSQVGIPMKAVATFASEQAAAAKPFKEIVMKITIDSGVATNEFIVNDFPNSTFEFAIPSNGRLRITPSGNILTSGKTEVVTKIISSGGNPYFVVPSNSFLPGIIDLNFKTFDNTQTGTPSLSSEIIRLRVYN